MSSLNVSGYSIFNNSITMKSNLNVSGYSILNSLKVLNDTNLNNNLNVSGTSIFNNFITIMSSLNVSGTSIFNNSITIYNPYFTNNKLSLKYINNGLNGMMPTISLNPSISDGDNLEGTIGMSSSIGMQIKTLPDLPISISPNDTKIIEFQKDGVYIYNALVGIRIIDTSSNIFPKNITFTGTFSNNNSNFSVDSTGLLKAKYGINSYTDNFYVDSSGNLTLKGPFNAKNGINTVGDNFYVDSLGNLTLKGPFNAKYGINSYTDNFYVDSLGNLTTKKLTLTDILIANNGINTNNNFYVDSLGNLTANKLTIREFYFGKKNSSQNDLYYDLTISTSGDIITYANIYISNSVSKNNLYITNEGNLITIGNLTTTKGKLNVGTKASIDSTTGNIISSGSLIIGTSSLVIDNVGNLNTTGYIKTSGPLIIGNTAIGTTIITDSNVKVNTITIGNTLISEDQLINLIESTKIETGTVNINIDFSNISKDHLIVIRIVFKKEFVRLPIITFDNDKIYLSKYELYAKENSVQTNSFDINIYIKYNSEYSTISINTYNYSFTYTATGNSNGKINHDDININYS